MQQCDNLLYVSVKEVKHITSMNIYESHFVNDLCQIYQTATTLSLFGAGMEVGIIM